MRETPADHRAHHDVRGTVPFLWWTCEDHEGADGFSGTTATFKHSQPCPYGEDFGSGGPIGEPPTYFLCSHRAHLAPIQPGDGGTGREER